MEIFSGLNWWPTPWNEFANISQFFFSFLSVFIGFNLVFKSHFSGTKQAALGLDYFFVDVVIVAL